MASLADVRTLCETNDCTPCLRTETRDGRVWVSLTAVQKAFPNKIMYDLRQDAAWDDAANMFPLLDRAIAEWWA